MRSASPSRTTSIVFLDEDEWNKPTFDQARKAEADLRAALAQPDPDPEPVAWLVRVPS